MKPGKQPLRSVRLLDQVRERIRYLHYSLSTEKVYLYWVRFFIHWQAAVKRGIRLRILGLFVTGQAALAARTYHRR